MGKAGGWIHTIKKAVHKHIDPERFQHLPSEHRRSNSSSQAVGESGHHEQEEKRRPSTSSSQVLRGGLGLKKSPKHDSAGGTRSEVSSWQANGVSGHHAFEKPLKDDSPPSSSRNNNGENGSKHYSPDELCRDAEGRRGRGDHTHLVKLYREERTSASSTSHNRFYESSNQQEKGRSSTFLEILAANDEESQEGAGGAAVGGRDVEKRRPSTSSQKEWWAHEKPSVEKGRTSNVSSSSHFERTVLEKPRSSTSSNNSVKISSSVQENRRPSTSSLPDDRTRALLTEKLKIPSENRRPSIDRGRPKTPSSPRMSQAALEKAFSEKSRSSTTGPASSQSDKLQPRAASTQPASPFPQVGKCTALQDFLKPPSFVRKSSSSSAASLSQVEGSLRSLPSEGSNYSEEFVELVFPLSEATRTSPHPPSPAVINQRKKLAIATLQEVYSLHEYEAPVSPGSQRRKSGYSNPKTFVPLPELGTKPLLPPDYRKQQPAAPVADLGAVIFHAVDVGVGGMLGEWAAVLIQSSWRGYVSRQAFKALRSLVKFQALVRGYLVRKRIKPLVNARIQAARVKNKLNRNAKVQLDPISDGYGIAQTLLDSQSCQYGFALPILDDSPTPAARKTSRTRDALAGDFRDWTNRPVKLFTLAELKQEALMKKDKAKQQQETIIYPN